MKKIIAKAVNIYNNQDNRTKSIIKQGGGSLFVMVANTLASFLIVPMTINYLDSTKYGIWLALSAIVGWIHYFNFGMSNGFRNRFTEAVTNHNTILAKQYVSTTYFAIGCIATIITLIILISNYFINWGDLLKVPQEYNHELTLAFAIIVVFTCYGMVIDVFATLLQADQRSGLMSFIQCIGQYLSLLSIFLLTKYANGSLLSLATFYSGIPYITMLIASIVMFKWSKYHKYTPSLKYVRLSLIKNIMGLGIKFFVIYMCLIVVFQLVNIIISRVLGPDAVTQYNATYKYFSVIYIVMGLLVAPLWSAFTEAYNLKDFNWLHKTNRLFTKLFILCIFGAIIMLLLSSYIYPIWLGNAVTIPFGLSLSMALLIICQTYGTVYMNMINGIGTIRIQMIVYLAFAAIAWPMYNIAIKNFGLIGIVAIPSIVYILQGLLAQIQVKKLINQSATGLWLK